ncbi:MAG: RnfABCDGE type electron transport complex subunit D, partial [Microcystaceae cyanobacterium]
PAQIGFLLLFCLLWQAGLTIFTDFSTFWGGLKKDRITAPMVMAKLNHFLTIASLKSAVITALGLGLLLRANSFSTLLLAATVAIASKFAIKVRGKHIFNPANIGIIAALSLTGDAWVSPGQWGTEGWLIAVFLGAGGLVLGKVGRWDTSVVFFALYGGLELARNAWLGWDAEVVFHHLGNGSLLVFTLFMLTDPRSIPNARLSRILWASAIAILTFTLQYTLYLPTAMFWALFICSPLTVLFDTYWQAPRFNWVRSGTLIPSFLRVNVLNVL